MLLPKNGNVKLTKLLHPSNAFLPIYFMLAGIFKIFKLMQSTKAFSSMPVTDFPSYSSSISIFSELSALPIPITL